MAAGQEHQEVPPSTICLRVTHAMSSSVSGSDIRRAVVTISSPARCAIIGHLAEMIAKVVSDADEAAPAASSRSKIKADRFGRLTTASKKVSPFCNTRLLK